MVDQANDRHGLQARGEGPIWRRSWRVIAQAFAE
jgi:hypothetical protein